ncbi:MAG: FkbM family methyltransferase [Nitrospirae bacterium]|nr:FkbM family methyltransferase [Nitrospirota bacterium]
MFTSYAQNFEDVMLWRALKHIKQGFYVDVGAQHPIIDSVSLAFYEQGWRGVHIEPVPAYADLLREHRPDEVVIQTAIASKEGILTFYELPETGLSTADREIAYRHKEKGFRVHEFIVPSLTLSEALSPFSGREIHWLKIDVEGYERQVLESWGSEIKPWVVVIESTLPLTQTESHQDWEHLILGMGYKFAYFDGLNRFFVSSKHTDLLSAFQFGPTVFDGFALSGSSSAPFCTNLNSKIEELSQHGQALETELGVRKRQVIEAQQHTERVEGELAQFRERFQALENELTQSRNAMAQQEQRLGAREAELAGVYRSRSWRMTAPLRSIFHFFRVAHHYFDSIPNRLLTLAKRSIKAVVRRLASRLRRFYLAKNIARFFRTRYPKLWDKFWSAFFIEAGQTSVESSSMVTESKKDQQIMEMVTALKQEIARQRNM